VAGEGWHAERRSCLRGPASDAEAVRSRSEATKRPQATNGNLGMSTPVPPLAWGLLERCHFPSAGTEVVCAVSGGADSLALLVLAVFAGCKVTAVHVDHGLRTESAAEAGVVEAVAARLGATFRSERVSVGPGANLEARAREARLGVLPAQAATGHTMDDQAETVLLNMLRGAGLDGIGAMRPGPRHPILELRRAETRALCQELGIEAVSDPSNDDPRFLRNRVRHELIPLMNEIARRDVVPLLARQALLAGDEASYLDMLASMVDPTDAAGVARAPLVLARRAIRSWLRGSCSHPPDLAAIERVLDVASGKRRATEVAPRVRIRRSHGRLSKASLPAEDPRGEIHSGSLGAR
jgi:tRNA(Ile)-lysidine synthase